MNAPSFQPRLGDVVVALALLSRLPLPQAAFAGLKTRPAAHAAWAYPLVGALVGAVAGLTGVIVLGLGLPEIVAAILALLVAVVITGAMHEDGLADCADGFWGAWDIPRRLEIMKDSQIGTYGVIALLICIALRCAALTVILPADGAIIVLMLSGVASRGAMVGVMTALPNARARGLSHQTGRPPVFAAGIAVALGGAAALWLGPLALFMAVFAALGVAAIAQSKIKGQTGDVLGATQQVSETTLLLTLCAALN